MTSPQQRTRRRILLVASLAMLLTPVSAQASVKNGAKCSKVGQLFTVKQKKKSVDFICTQEGKKKVWRLRPGGATGSLPGGAVTTPGGTTGGGTTAKPGEAPGGTASASDCDKAQYRQPTPV